jgi:uncharacterized membrane protein YecN with MAPEG domain
MQIPVICVSILGLLVFMLGLLISMVRGKTGIIYYGDSLDDPTSLLTKAVRALGNTAEFSPMLAVMFLYLATTNPDNWVLWTIVAATISRVLMVVGFLTAGTLRKIHPLKGVGAVGTYLSGFALCVAMVQSVI